MKKLFFAALIGMAVYAASAYSVKIEIKQNAAQAGCDNCG